MYFRFSFCFKHANLQRNGLRLFQRGIYWQHLEVGAAKKFPFGFFFSLRRQSEYNLLVPLAFTTE